MKKSLFVFFASLLGLHGYGQESQNSISFTPFGGVPYSNFSNAVQGHTFGGELGYHISMRNNVAPWAQDLNVEDIGILFSYINMQHASLKGMPGTNNLTGNIYTVAGSADMNVFNTDGLKFIVSPRLGLAYVSKNYKQDGNYLNASNANFMAGIAFMCKYGPFKFGLEGDHISSASFEVPNAGEDFVKAIFGIQQPIAPEGPTNRNYSDEYNQNSLEFGFGAGKRGLPNRGYFYDSQGKGFYLTPEEEAKQGSSHLYQIGMYAGYNYRIVSVLSVRAGIDGVYYTHPYLGNSNHGDFFKSYQELNSSYDKLSLGFDVMPTIWLGRFSFGAGYGRYLHFNSPTGVKSYWEIRPQYQLTPWVAADMTVNYHNGQSGYANFGVVFNFFKQ